MYEQLYDEYAVRLYGYCWSLVGEEAPRALEDTFVSAARQGGPRATESAEVALWLYGLARRACLRRRPAQASTRPDPLDRAAAALRPDQREAVILAAGALEPTDIARLLGVAPDTARQLIGTGRTRLQTGVLDACLTMPLTPDDAPLLAAFERNALDTELARRAPTGPPASLRALVLTSCLSEASHPLSHQSVTRHPAPDTGPLVVIQAPGGSAPRRPARRVAGALTVAACAAAVAGVMATATSSDTGVPRSGPAGLTSSTPAGDGPIAGPNPTAAGTQATRVPTPTAAGSTTVAPRSPSLAAVPPLSVPPPAVTTAVSPGRPSAGTAAGSGAVHPAPSASAPATTPPPAATSAPDPAPTETPSAADPVPGDPTPAP